MDVIFQIFSAKGKADLFLYHRRRGFKPVLREDFQSFREKVCNLSGIAVKQGESFALSVIYVIKRIN